MTDTPAVPPQTPRDDAQAEHLDPVDPLVEPAEPTHGRPADPDPGADPQLSPPPEPMGAEPVDAEPLSTDPVGTEAQQAEAQQVPPLYDEDRDGIDDPAPAPITAGGHAASGATGLTEPDLAARPQGAATVPSQDAAHDEPVRHAPAPQIVYVESPVPPKSKGNRLFGTLLAIAGTVLFGLLYAGIAALLLGRRASTADMTRFLSDPIFWAPVLIFLVAFVVAVLLLNRAAWWVHVLASLVVALVVYAGTIGVGLLTAGGLGLTPTEAATAANGFARNPFVIVAAVLAREVAMWTGLGIAARGRRVKQRNVERREAFDREQAEKRAERERASQRV